MNKIMVFIGVFASVVVTITAYNFDNPDYNQYLADDLEELYSDSVVSNVRTRRDAPDVDDKCRRRKPKLCCGEEVIHKLNDDKKDIRAACFKEITGKDKPEKPHHGRPFDPFDCEKMNEKKNEMMCILQCVGQKNNIIADNGDVKAEEFLKYIKDKLADIEYLAPVHDKIFEGCLADFKNATNTDSKCKPDGTIAEFCLFKNIQLNCPEDQIKDKEVCHKIQERLKQGRAFLPGPPPPPPEH